MPATDKPELTDAGDTDEVYNLAYHLAAWGLRNGECTEYDAVDWVLDHPHEDKLPRGSRGTLNPTRHHITSGAEVAVEKYEPGTFRPEFDPDPLHELAARISGSGVTHERHLLGAIALCFKHETLTPVITGPNLAEVVGVAKNVANKVLRQWSDTKAYGFFTKISYDGQHGHGRVWTVNPDWTPTSKPRHLSGCNRSAARCRCPGMSQNGLPIFTAAKDRSPKVRQLRRDTNAEFREWLMTLDRRTPLTVTDVAKHLGVTRAAATKLLREQQGHLLDEFTHAGGRIRKRQPDGTHKWVRRGETWFVGKP